MAHAQSGCQVDECAVCTRVCVGDVPWRMRCIRPPHSPQPTLEEQPARQSSTTLLTTPSALLSFCTSHLSPAPRVLARWVRDEIETREGKQDAIEARGAIETSPPNTTTTNETWVVNLFLEARTGVHSERVRSHESVHTPAHSQAHTQSQGGVSPVPVGAGQGDESDDTSAAETCTKSDPQPGHAETGPHLVLCAGPRGVDRSEESSPCTHAEPYYPEADQVEQGNQPLPSHAPASPTSTPVDRWFENLIRSRSRSAIDLGPALPSPGLIASPV